MRLVDFVIGILLYVCCLYVGMGTAQRYYSMSGAFMLEWEQSKANIIFLVPLCWDGYNPNQIYVWCLHTGMDTAQTKILYVWYLYVEMGKAQN